MRTDLAFPTKTELKKTHKRKRLFVENTGFFMEVRCAGCHAVTLCYSHSQISVPCAGCEDIILRPRGGKAVVSEGCAFRRINYVNE